MRVLYYLSTIQIGEMSMECMGGGIFKTCLNIAVFCSFEELPRHSINYSCTHFLYSMNTCTGTVVLYMYRYFKKGDPVLYILGRQKCSQFSVPQHLHILAAHSFISESQSY